MKRDTPGSRQGRTTTARPARWAPRIAAAAALAAAAPACAVTTPESALAADIRSVRAEQTPDKLLERGRAFASVRDYTRAEQYLSAALKAGAPAASVLPLLLRVCVEENRYRIALIYAEPELRSHPDDYRLRFVVASLYRNIGDARSALDHLQIIAAARPDYAEVQYAMGVIYRDDASDPVGADTHFREYLRIEPEGRHAPEARSSLLKQVVGAGPEPTPKAGDPPRGGAAAAKRTWQSVP